MKPIEAEKIWKMDLNPKDNQLKEVNDKYNDEKEEVKAQVPENHPEIKKAQIPISYKQLQDYGYCIISIQKYDSEGHSKYKLAPVNIQLTFLQKELQLKHKLTGLPSFLKIYITRKEAKRAICTLVSERFSKKSIEWEGEITLNI